MKNDPAALKAEFNENGFVIVENLPDSTPLDELRTRNERITYGKAAQSLKFPTPLDKMRQNS